MRVAIFSDSYLPEVNGVATSVNTLFQAFRRNGHDAYVVTTNPFSNKIVLEDNVLRVPGIELKKLYGYRLAGFYYPGALKILRDLKLDVIHINSEAGIGWFGKLTALALRKPVVYTYHTMIEDYTHYVNRGHFVYYSQTIINRYSRFFGETCTELISPSNKTKDALRRYGVGTHISIIPTGIPLQKFAVESVQVEAVAELKQRFKLGDEPTIVYLGRIAKEKSIDVLVHGFAQLVELTDIPVKLVIVGSGPAVNELEVLVHSYHLQDRVVFTGKAPQAETQNYYQLATIFASASLSETQGLTYLEAMAGGKPLLWRYDRNLDEMLIDQRHGYIFTDAVDFAAKALKLLQRTPEQVETMRAACLKRAEDFSAETFYQKVLEVYQRAVRKKW